MCALLAMGCKKVEVNFTFSSAEPKAGESVCLMNCDIPIVLSSTPNSPPEDGAYKINEAVPMHCLICHYIASIWLYRFPSPAGRDRVGLVSDYRLSFSISLKYRYVPCFNSAVAASSQTMIAWGCICRAEIVHSWLTPASIACCRARALL